MHSEPLLFLLLLAGLAGCTTAAAPLPDAVARPTIGAADDHTAPADVLTYRGDSARSGRMPGPGPSEAPTIRWSLGAGGPIQSQVVVVAGVVHVVSTDGTVRAVDLLPGRERWHTSLGARAYSSPTVADGLVLVGADDGLHALRLEDGSAAWTAASTGRVRGTPAVVDAVAISVSTTGLVSAVDVPTGAVRWGRKLASGGDTSVAASDGVAVIGLADGSVTALDVRDGSERWRVVIGDGARVGTPTIADGSVFVVTLDGGSGHHVARLDLATGRLAWSVPSPGGETAYSPVVANGVVIMGSEGRSMVALDASTGGPAWQARAPGVVEVVTAVAGDTAYSASNGGAAFAVDTLTGTRRWDVSIEGVPYGVAVTSGLVLVGTSAGTLYAIGSAR